MKYKKTELELPPLGKDVCVSNAEGEIDYGFFYVRRGERHFQSCSLFYRMFFSEWTYWAIMPDFKDPKKELPPVGHSVLGCCAEGVTSFREYMYVVLLDDMDKIMVDGKEIDGWIEPEALDKGDTNEV